MTTRCSKLRDIWKQVLVICGQNFHVRQIKCKKANLSHFVTAKFKVLMVAANIDRLLLCRVTLEPKDDKRT
jgi:hypothetical protein